MVKICSDHGHKGRGLTDGVEGTDDHQGHGRAVFSVIFVRHRRSLFIRPPDRHYDESIQHNDSPERNDVADEEPQRHLVEVDVNAMFPKWRSGETGLCFICARIRHLKRFEFK